MSEQRHEAPPGRRRRRMTAAWLALVLGGLGAHRFYLGQTAFGLFYLALCWTFVPAIIALIEFLIFATMRDEVFERRYG